MAKRKTYCHAATSATFKHEVIHVDKAGPLIKAMKRKAKSIGLPPSMPMSQLARIAITAWVQTAKAADGE